MADNQKPQPTILVKKADGTTERITLLEFRKRKQASASQSEVAEQKAPEKIVTPVSPIAQRRIIPLVEEEEITRPAAQTAKPVVQQPPRRVIPLVEEVEVVKPLVAAKVAATTAVVHTETHIANTTPVTKVFEHSTTPKLVRKTENSVDPNHRSLLDEDDSEIKAIGEKKGQSVRHTPAASVSFSSSVQIPKDLQARTSALILSWKKGIRDQYQFIDYAARPASEGGLGLTKVDAMKLFEEISQSATLGAPRIARPATVPSTVPLTSPISTPSQKKPQLNHIPSSTTLIREIAPTREPATVMGPIEEAASLSIEDFRRLSRIPKTAGEMMVAKFSGWKDESYLLYLQVRDSWRNSPLFRLYIEKTTEAIEKNLTITAVLERAQLTYEEYLAIAEINRKLGQMD